MHRYLKLFIVYYIIILYCYILLKYDGYITSAASVERLFHFSIVAVAEVILYKNVISIASATSVEDLKGRLYFSFGPYSGWILIIIIIIIMAAAYLLS